MLDEGLVADVDAIENADEQDGGLLVHAANRIGLWAVMCKRMQGIMEMSFLMGLSRLNYGHE